jgi:hypothetical protein
MSEVVLTAMAPHPKDRPVSIALWQQMLHSFDTTRPIHTQSVVAAEWSSSLRENWWLVSLATAMLIVALWITFFSA